MYMALEDALMVVELVDSSADSSATPAKIGMWVRGFNLFTPSRLFTLMSTEYIRYGLKYISRESTDLNFSHASSKA